MEFTQLIQSAIRHGNVVANVDVIKSLVLYLQKTIQCALKVTHGKMRFAKRQRELIVIGIDPSRL